MKDPVQKKDNATMSGEQEQEKVGGSATMAPPSFALSSAPVQKKENPQAAEKKPLNKQEQFLTKYAASAVALENKDGIPALFTLAQGALESGWGEKAIGNALFGIKAGKNWKGKKQLVTTTEYFDSDTHRDDFPEVISVTKTDKGKYKYIVKDWFRDYDTVEEGLADHSAFLITNKRYAGAFNTETPEDFARAVAAAGYATAAGYADTLIAVMKSVRKYWPADAGPIPTGNSKSITGGKPGGQTQDPKKPDPKTDPKGGSGNAGTTNPGKGNSISGSVGDGGANKPEDALIVKGLLIKAGYPLSNTADVGPKTIGYIKEFQSKVLGWKNPDGLVEPGGATFNALMKGQVAAKPKEPTKVTPPPAGLNFDAMADRLNTAMFGGWTGAGTDEAAIYATLSMLERDGDRIQKLKAAYSRKFGRDLVADLRSELSDSYIFGNELSKALQMLSPKASAPAKEGAGSKPTTSGNTPAKTPASPANASSQTAGSTGAKLDTFFSDFSNIKVVVGDKVVNVTPPYFINRGDRLDNALAERKSAPKVTSMVDSLIKQGKVTANAKVGKSQPADLKAILEEAINQGLVTHDATAMHNFLAKYGYSVDCSGYVTQALNFLMDGNQTQDSKDNLKPGNYGSGSLKGGTADFTKVNISDVQAGDTMHLEGHIRIINEVVKEGDVVFFRTAESTAAKNGETGMNGIMTRWWMYKGGKKYNTWKGQNGAHPAADDKGWKASSETNTFGRYKKL